MTLPLVTPENTWPIWALLVAGTAVCIHLEQTWRWAARISGPVLALIVGMVLSNCKIMPTASSSYDVVEDYLVPAAIPLLLFRANLVRIVRETGPMLLAFHVAAVGTTIGAFLAAFLFRGAFDHLPEVTGIMTGSYIGGGVNFVALKDSYQISENLTNPLLVADNFIMAGMFAMLLIIAGSKAFRRWYPHPHSIQGDREDVVALAARHWKRKEISLLDIAQALAIAFVIAAISIKVTGFLKGQVESRLMQSVIGNPFLLITFLTVTFTTLGQRWTEKIQGADDLGMYLLYLFFFVIGLKADLIEVVTRVPVLFLFCLVMAGTSLAFALVVGKLLRLNLEELLLGVNASLGGAPSAAAMAISRGWSNLVLPGLLAGIWGYVIGTFIGILVTETLLRFFGP
jgi:uncharacterized membrane protein